MLGEVELRENDLVPGRRSGGIAPLDARRRLNFVCYADNYRLYCEVDTTPTLRDNPWETTWG